MQFEATHGYSVPRSNSRNRMNGTRDVGVGGNASSIMANYNNSNVIQNNNAEEMSKSFSRICIGSLPFVLLRKFDKNKEKLNNEHSFPLVLSRRWKMVFIDSLVQFDRLQLNVIANQSNQDIFEDKGITIFKQICRRGLSHLLSVEKLNTPVAGLVCDNVKNIHDSAQWLRGLFYERFQDIVHKIVI